LAAFFRKGKKDEKTNVWLVGLINANLLPIPACILLFYYIYCNYLKLLYYKTSIFSEMLLAFSPVLYV